MSNYKPTEEFLKENGFLMNDLKNQFVLNIRNVYGVVYHIGFGARFEFQTSGLILVINIQSDSDLITFLKIIKPRKELDL